MRECRGCSAAFDERFRFCPWCGAAQRLKIVEYFSGVQVAEDDEAKGLRVSRYLTSPPHVRFSVWGTGEVKAALSLDDAEARRLGQFLGATDPPAASRLRRTADALRHALR